MLNSTDINYLIYRYLQESGFTHSSFVFGHESFICKSAISASEVKPGALIHHLQKALQYTEAETHVLEDGMVIDCKQSFSLIGEHVCDEKRIIPLESIGGKRIKLEEPVKILEAEILDSADNNTSEIFGASDSKQIEGCHKGEIFSAEWAPVNPNFFASCGADSTAKLWNLRDISLHNNKCITMKHGGEKLSSKNVFAQSWNTDGSLLATGCSDGSCRIWNLSGKLSATYSQQTSASQNTSNAVFALKWNVKSDYLISMSAKRVYLWSTSGIEGNGPLLTGTETSSTTATGSGGRNSTTSSFSSEKKNSWVFGSESQLFDIDWRNNSSFAVAGRNIYVCKAAEANPVKTLKGHTDDINAIRWNTAGTLLASCSDDKTIRIWSMKKEHHISNFDKHVQPVTTIRWRPMSSQPYLASASVDSTVKLWDVERNLCLSSLTKHTGSVDCIEFSPNGEFLLSGSDDSTLNIWSLKDRQIVKSYGKEVFLKNASAKQTASNGFTSASWNSDGTKIAVFNPANVRESSITILDFRM